MAVVLPAALVLGVVALEASAGFVAVVLAAAIVLAIAVLGAAQSDRRSVVPEPGRSPEPACSLPRQPVSSAV